MKKSEESWDSFYARTQYLPSPEATSSFLNHLPRNAKVLDFGTGSGRWAAAFIRDRPDLTIDLLDQNIEQASLIPEKWKGKIIKTSFENYVPSKKYHGIWSFASLFFMNNSDLEKCLSKLIDALEENGVIEFSMVDKCPAADNFKLYGMAEVAMRKILEEKKLLIDSIKLNNDAKYGKNMLLIPTYHVRATKN